MRTSNKRVAVSVLMPVFNETDRVGTAIRSVMNQSFRDLELVVVDDGSTDGTSSKLAQLASKDDRIRVITNEENAGLVASLNRGLAACQGELIARLDADDWAWPQRIERQFKIFADHRAVVLCATGAERVDSVGARIGESIPPTSHAGLAAGMLVGNRFLHSSAMFRRTAIDDVGGYDPAWYPVEDYDVWLRLLERGEYLGLPTIELSYTHNPTGISSTHSEAQLQRRLARAARYRSSLSGRPERPDASGAALMRDIGLAAAALRRDLERRAIPTTHFDAMALRAVNSSMERSSRVSRLVQVSLCTPRLAIMGRIPGPVVPTPIEHGEPVESGALQRLAAPIIQRWNRALRPHRWLMLLRCLLPLPDHVTVVIVNWQSKEFLEVACSAIKRFSPRGTRVLVVDNASTDGSLEWMRQQRIRCVSLQSNVGHSVGLDRGFSAVRTRTAVALDVDAFPISPEWIPELLRRLDGGATVAGAHGGDVLDRLMPEWDGSFPSRDFVHPCCLAMRIRRFAFQRHTFQKVTHNGVLLKDAGELISDRERAHLSMLEPTSHYGPGAVGTVFGGVVYHNFYSKRHAREARDEVDGISIGDPRRAWDRALSEFL
jgi:glycosyltransferase involved in cell wall biosynthesis